MPRLHKLFYETNTGTALAGPHNIFSFHHSEQVGVPQRGTMAREEPRIADAISLNQGLVP
jgi:hypothetical protein